MSSLPELPVTAPSLAPLSPLPQLPKVVWLLDSLRLGGAERLALAFAQEYTRRGGQVRIIALRAAPRGEIALEAEADRLGLDWTCLRARNLRDRAAWRRLQRHLGHYQPTVLHAHLRYATLWGGLAAVRRRLPLAVTLHVLPSAGRDGWRQAALARWEMWALNRVARRVLVLGADQAAAWQRAGLDPCRQCLLPNGISLAAPAPDARRQLRANLGIPPGAPLFLTVAAVRAGKGWRDWLEVQSQIRRQQPLARFVWLGAGPELEELRQHARGHAGVYLPGLQINVSDWLAAADVFLFPSHQEAMPTALAEALAAGLPAAAYALPANREVANGIRSVCWAPPADIPALAAAACQAVAAPRPLSDRPAAAASEAGPAGIRQTGTGPTGIGPAGIGPTGIWIDRLTAVYRELAAAGPPPGRADILAVEFFSRGGLFHYTLQLSAALARQGATVTLLTGRRPELTPAPVAGLEFAPVLPTWDPRQPSRHGWRARLQRARHGWQYVRAWARVLRWARRRRPQWVLLGDLEHRCDGWGAAALRRLGLRIADICHNPAMFDRRLWRRGPRPALTRNLGWRRRALARLDVLFVHAPVLADQITACTGRRAIVIPHGNQNLFLAAAAGSAQEPAAEPDWRRQWGWPPEQPIALLFGTLTRYKGIPTLLRAMASLPPAARPGLVIAGFPAAGVDPGAWRQEAQRQDLDPWLRWELGYVPLPRVPGLMGAVDFVVLPYWEASQSGVAHLALTFGRPVIATTCGGLPAVIRDGENGLLIPPRDAAALASALHRLTASPALRARLAQAASAPCPERGWEAIASRVLRQLAAAEDQARLAGGAESPAATAKSFGRPAPS